MKNAFIILALFLTCHTVYNQNPYYKLIDTNAVFNFTGCYGPPPYYTTFYRFKADTLLNSFQYYRVESSGDSLTWYATGLFTHTLLREDTLNRKVWILSDYTDEGLIYDFSLQSGDSLVAINTACSSYLFTYHVLSVDSVQMSDATYRKRFHLNAGTWIEGIGNFSGLIRNACMLTGFCEDFVCYYQNNQFMYKNPAYPTCFYSNPDDYFKYVDTNKLWNYTETYSFGAPDITTLFRFKKDTLIGSQNYYIAESTSDSVNWHDLSQYYREEDRKVYIWHNGTESLVFDAGAYIGDTLQIFHDNMGNPSLCPDTCLIKIMAIDLVNTGGLYRKRFYFQYLNCPNANDYWITGIGFQYGIVKHCYQYIGPPMLRLVCYYENDDLMFRNPAYPTCFSVWVNAEEQSEAFGEDILLYAKGEGLFTVESELKMKRIDVFSITSHTIMSQETDSHIAELNLNTLTPGIYIARVLTDNGRQYVLKICR